MGLIAERIARLRLARAWGYCATKVNAHPIALIFQCPCIGETPWLSRGAKKINEPAIPLIFQAFGWLNRAAPAA